MTELDRLTGELNDAVDRRLRRIEREVEDYRMTIIRAMMPVKEGK